MVKSQRVIALSCAALAFVASGCGGCVERELEGTRCDLANPCGGGLSCQEGRCVAGGSADAGSLLSLEVLAAVPVSGVGTESCASLAVSPGGGVVLGCTSNSTVTWGKSYPPLNPGQPNGLVVRLDPQRQVRWVRRLGHPEGVAQLNDLAFTADGGEAALGTFMKYLRLPEDATDPESQYPATVPVAPGVYGTDTFLVQYDAEGELRWHKVVGRDPPDAGADDAGTEDAGAPSCVSAGGCKTVGRALISASEDRLFIAGAAHCCSVMVDGMAQQGRGRPASADLFVFGVREGSVEWLHSGGVNGDDQVLSLSWAPESPTPLLAAGYVYDGPLLYSGVGAAGPTTSAGGTNALLLGLRATGEVDAFLVVESGTDEHFSAIEAVPSGGFVVAGKMKGPVVLGGTSPLPFAGAEDVFVARYDSSWKRQWVHVFGSPAVENEARVALGQGGEVWLAFVAARPQDGELALLTAPEVSLPVVRHGGQEIAVAQFSADGELRGFGLFGGDGASNGVGKIVALEDGNLALAGWFSGSARFGAEEMQSLGSVPDAGAPSDGLLLIVGRR